MLLNDALKWRYAVREFSEKELARSDVDKILEDTRLTASSYGLQPYKIIIVSSPEIKERLVSASYGQEKVSRCSNLLVFATSTEPADKIIDDYILNTSETRQIPLAELEAYKNSMYSALSPLNKDELFNWAKEQTFIALGTLLASAAVNKIDSCPMGGINAEEYDSILGLDQKNLKTSVVCPIGYRSVEDTHSNLPKVRLSKSNFIINM